MLCERMAQPTYHSDVKYLILCRIAFFALFKAINRCKILCRNLA